MTTRKKRGNWEALRVSYWDKVNALLAVTPSQAAKEIQERQDATAKAAFRMLDAAHAMIEDAIALASKLIRECADHKEALEAAAIAVDLYKKATGGSSALISALKPDVPVELLKALQESIDGKG